MVSPYASRRAHLLCDIKQVQLIAFNCDTPRVILTCHACNCVHNKNRQQKGRTEMDSRNTERMPEQPAGVSNSEWLTYRARATAAQGLEARRRLAEEFGLPIIPPTVLAI